MKQKDTGYWAGRDYADKTDSRGTLVPKLYLGTPYFLICKNLVYLTG